MEKLKDYFKRYPVSQEVYENGGQLFHNRGAADSYGKGETKKYTRQSVNSEQLAVNSELTKEDAISKLKAMEDLSALSHDELKSFAKVLDLKTEDNRKATFLKALFEYKATLKDE
jgi:hypothetical protein